MLRAILIKGGPSSASATALHQSDLKHSCFLQLQSVKICTHSWTVCVPGGGVLVMVCTVLCCWFVIALKVLLAALCLSVAL
jgi:hypothetical protein